MSPFIARPLLLALMLLSGGGSSFVDAGEKLNVLFVAADDLNCSLGCYGNEDVRTPNLDRLAKQGTLFKKAYCQQAVCNPSRASLLTGLRPDKIRVWDLRTDFRDAVPDAVTLPQHFKRHGYYTRCIGKMFHNMGNLDDEPSWSVPSMLNAGRHSDTYALTKPGLKPGTKRGAFERADLPDETYRDGKIADLACDQLREIGDQPFFLAVGFWRPHLPFLAPKKYWDLYERDELHLPDEFAPPASVPEISLHDSRELKSYGPDPQNLSEAERRELWHGYYASISYMDAQVGKLLETLKETGLDKTTVVVFWSDHGFHLGQHSLWCKTSCFELDARVPLIISAPGFKKGQVSDALVELVDLSPTLAGLCGLAAPESDGKSLTSILQDQTETVKNYAITQHPRPAYYKGKPEVMGYSMRTENLRYTEWRNWETGDVIAKELYDHRRDPHEMHNVVASDRYQTQLEELSQMLSSAIK
ncbi:sulfatase [Thalassoglobus sp.]|uniref:sulfatase n=1 Tax=Thalassoglobus sp. TaxID=2795869 RepID=UPI003AA9B5B0